MRKAVGVAIIATAWLAGSPSGVAAQEFPASASFAQLAGADGCLVQEGNRGEGCRRARALLQPTAIAVAPDQRHVYITTGGTALSGSSAVTAFSRDAGSGALEFAGCVSDSGGDGRVGTDGFCADGDALLGASALALSPDGRFVYVAAAGSNGLTWLARDPATGALTPAGCLKAVPRLDRCGQAPALIGAGGVAVSPDGTHVYVTASGSGAVTAFARDAATGALTEVMCVSDTGSDGRCADGTGLAGASSVAVAADGRDVYVTAAAVGAVTSYRRDPATGRLRPADCLLDDAVRGGACRSAPGLGGASDLALAPDGRQLVVASRLDSALAIFSRDADTGRLAATGCLRNEDPKGDDDLQDDEEDEEEDSGEDAEDAQTEDCRPAKAIKGVTRVAVSPDGRGVFASSPGDYLAAFDRDARSGELRQFGCAEEDRVYRSCAQARNMIGARALAVSGDARSLYVATDEGVAVFEASTAIISRVATVHRRGSIRVRLACPKARARACAGRLRLVARGAGARRFDVPAGRTARVTLRLPGHVQRATKARRSVQALVRATDERRRTTPTVAPVVLRRG